MRDKVVFFILGALLATIAYTAGDLETLTAQKEPTEFPPVVSDLIVKNRLAVLGNDGEYILMGPDQNGGMRIILKGKGEDVPKILLRVDEDSGLIGIDQGKDANNVTMATSKTMSVISGESHGVHPESRFHISITNYPDGPTRSEIYLEDPLGKNGVDTD